MCDCKGVKQIFIEIRRLSGKINLNFFIVLIFQETIWVNFIFPGG